MFGNATLPARAPNGQHQAPPASDAWFFFRGEVLMQALPINGKHAAALPAAGFHNRHEHARRRAASDARLGRNQASHVRPLAPAGIVPDQPVEGLSKDV